MVRLFLFHHNICYFYRNDASELKTSVEANEPYIN
jgi:hypothetical protein